MRSALVLAAVVAISGCGVQQLATTRPTEAQPSAVEAPVAQEKAQPLPFKGRLVGGDPAELPPAVAMSLSDTSPVTFAYREELTHDEYHIPLIFTALDPVTYVGAPLGDYGVSAFASLTISEGDRTLGDYTAKAYVSKSYSLYSQPTHRELEQAASAAVRERIDQKLYRDAGRLAQAAASTGKSARSQVGN